MLQATPHRAYTFRQLVPAEMDAGYACLMDTCTWLGEKGIRQWLRPLPRDVYERRHARGENYALFDGKEIAAIVSLMTYVPEYWQDLIPETSITWMATLAARVHGEGIGAKTVQCAVELLTRKSRLPVYLDCRPGYLERFYCTQGFASLGTRSFQPAPDFAYDATLMRL